MRRRLFLFTLSVILCFSFICFVGCSSSDNDSATSQYDEIIKPAIEVLKKGWEDDYKKTSLENQDNRLYIKNCRIVELKNSTEASMFENVQYVVEFVLYSDYYGTGGKYFTNVGMNDSVVVYKDGSMKIYPKSIFQIYINQYYDLPFRFVSNVTELDGIYNQTLTLDAA